MKSKNKGLTKILNLVKALNHSEFISKRSISNVSKILNITNDHEIIIRNYFLSKGIPLERHDHLFDFIVNNYIKINDIKHLIKPKINSDVFLKNKNLFKLDNIFDKISLEFLQSIVQYKWAGSPTIGSGEIFLCLSLTDVFKPLHGDIQIDNKILEVKANTARLRGQKYYLDTTSVHIYITNQIKKYLKLTKVKSDYINDLLKSTSPNKYNLNVSNFGFYYAYEILYSKATSKLKPLLLESLMTIFDKILVNYSEKTRKFLHKNLELALTDEITFYDFFKELTNVITIDSFHRYFYEENINTIIFINTKNLNCLIINETNLIENLNKFKIRLPSLSIKSGPQGISTGVTLL